MSSTTVPNPANGSFPSRSSRLSTGCVHLLQEVAPRVCWPGTGHATSGPLWMAVRRRFLVIRRNSRQDSFVRKTNTGGEIHYSVALFELTFHPSVTEISLGVNFLLNHRKSLVTRDEQPITTFCEQVWLQCNHNGLQH